MRINYQRCGILHTISTCHVSDTWWISHSTESFEACITKNVVIPCIGMWPTLIVFQQSPTHWLLHLICQNHHGKVKQWIYVRYISPASESAAMLGRFKTTVQCMELEPHFFRNWLTEEFMFFYLWKLSRLTYIMILSVELIFSLVSTWDSLR